MANNAYTQNILSSLPPGIQPIILVQPQKSNSFGNKTTKILLLLLVSLCLFLYAYRENIITYKQVKDIVGKDGALIFNEYIHTYIPKSNKCSELKKTYPDRILGTKIDKYDMIRLKFLELDTTNMVYRPSPAATAENMHDLGYMMACKKERTEENWMSELGEMFIYPTQNGFMGDLPNSSTEFYRKKYKDLFKEYVKGYVSGASDIGIPEP